MSAGGPSYRSQPPLRRTAPELKALIEAERTGVPFLVWRDGGGVQQILLLGGVASVMVGRGSASDLVLTDEETSRAHAELRRLGVEWTIEDDGLSRNGTFVNEVRITQRRRLVDRDVMRFGQTRIEFRRPLKGSTLVTAPGDQPVLAYGLTDTQRAILVALCRPLRQDASFSDSRLKQCDRRRDVPQRGCGKEPPACSIRPFRDRRPRPEPEARSTGRICAANGDSERARAAPVTAGGTVHLIP